MIIIVSSPGGLTGAEISSVSADSVEGFQASAIPFIPDAVFSAMPGSLLSEFSPSQAQAVTAGQRSGLDATQTSSLNTAQYGDDAPNTGGGGGGGGGGSGSANIGKLQNGSSDP